MPHLLACPDKFKGTATAQELAQAMCEAAGRANWSGEAVPLADGGEGTLEVLGGPNRRSRVTGPLGQSVDAEWRLDGTDAVIEVARTSGLTLAGGPEANLPMEATTRGTGELILAAVGSGARRITVCLGGSATTDGGWGAVEVLEGRLAGVEIQVACDVDALFAEAASVFAPQKGASRAQVALLDRRLQRLAQIYRDQFGVDVSGLTGAGAAGGLAGGLAALGARLVPGFDLVADAVDLYEKVERADLVVTGEGFLDEQSFAGKVVGGVAELCAESSVPLVVVAGQIFDEARRLVPENLRVELISLSEACGPERSRSEPLACVSEAVIGHLSRA
jgi:glycerate 2-kinase